SRFGPERKLDHQVILPAAPATRGPELDLPSVHGPSALQTHRHICTRGLAAIMLRGPRPDAGNARARTVPRPGTVHLPIRCQNIGLEPGECHARPEERESVPGNVPLSPLRSDPNRPTFPPHPVSPPGPSFVPRPSPTPCARRSPLRLPRSRHPYNRESCAPWRRTGWW